MSIHRDGEQLFTCVRLDDLRYLHLHMGLQVVEGRVLGLQLNGSVVTPADFQNKAATVAVDLVIEVLLAAQRLQGAGEAVMLLKQVCRLIGVHLRAR